MNERLNLSQLFTGRSEDEPEVENGGKPLPEVGGFESFRKELLESMRNIAVFSAALEQHVRHHPETTADELRVKFKEHIQNMFVTEEARETADALLDGYARLHTAVNWYFEQYDNDELYETIFGRLPYGKVEVILGPITLAFVCFDLRDYERIYGGVFDDEDYDAKIGEIKMAKHTGGVFLHGAPFPELKGAIIGENASETKLYSQATIDHEERHAKQFLISPFGPEKDFEYKLAGSADLEDRKRNFFQYFKYLRDCRGEEYVLSEVLSYIKGGTSNANIVRYLTQKSSEGGLYDYYDDLVVDMEEKYRNDELAKVILTEVFGADYKKMLEDGLAAFDEIQAHLQLSVDETIELVQVTPVRYWPNLMRRFKKYDYVPEFMGGKLIKKENRYWKDLDCMADEFDRLGKSRPKQANKKSGTR